VNEFRKNGAVFAAFKNHQQTKDIIALLTDENGDVRSFRKFKKLALQLSEKYNVNWLRTEYNTAVSSARAAMKFREYLETENVYPNLEYMESMASHKREAHLKYVGTVLPIRHQWWNTHLPPSDWNCKCWVRPTRKAATPVPEEELVPPVFSNNPGTSAKFIKTEETPYYKNTDANLQAEIEALAKRLENIRQRLAQLEFTRKKFKSGGYIDVPKTGQNKNEQTKNIKIYEKLAKSGEKYALLDVREGTKNPDAVNLKSYGLSDAKSPVSENIKNAVQNSIKAASAQKVDEVVIQLTRESNVSQIKKGLFAAFQKGRAETIKKVIVINENNKIQEFDAASFQ
jgi:hypothetical protein